MQLESRDISIVYCQYCHKSALEMFHQHIQNCKPNIAEKINLVSQIGRCHLCLEEMNLSKIGKHVKECAKLPIPCTMCKIKLNRKDMDIHLAQAHCCKWCIDSFKKNEEIEHEVPCLKMIQHQENLMIMEMSQTMTKLQIQVLDTLQKYSVQSHFVYRPNVKDLVNDMRYTEKELLTMTEYVAEKAPIIIHFELSKEILQGRFYRNEFQNKESGEAKENLFKKEKNLFDGLYNNAKDKERVKYGVLNISNDIKGVKNCHNKGSAYFVLKQSVRKRCTIANSKGKYQKEGIKMAATLPYCYSVMSAFSKNDMEAIKYASQGYFIESDDLQGYKEVHIHGPVSFAEDIQCICAPAKEIEDLKEEFIEFTKRFEVPVKAIELMTD